MASLNFNAQNVAPQQSYTPIPAGVYTVAIIESDVKPTRSGGQQAVFTLQVTEGQFAGRKVFARINVRNQSSEAERIGQSQLSALCHAAGVLQLQDTAQLHGKIVRARVTVRKDDTGQYGDSNDVKAFEAVGAGAPAAPTYAPPQASAPASAAPGADVPPWQKAKAA